MFHFCPQCHTQIVGRRKDSVYCSHACRQDAYRKRIELKEVLM